MQYIKKYTIFQYSKIHKEIHTIFQYVLTSRAVYKKIQTILSVTVTWLLIFPDDISLDKTQLQTVLH